MKIKNFIFEILETFLSSFVVIMVLYALIASVEVVYGASMEPNFHSGERILVDRISKYIFDFKRGEVVVFFPPGDDTKHYIKRVIGLPGDIVKILDCKVMVSRDGEHYEIEETYLSDGECTSGGLIVKEGRSLKLNEEEYLLLGDNRDESLDSRVLGLVKKDRLIGRVVFRFWPVSQIGFVN